MIRFGGPVFLDEAKAAVAGESQGAAWVDPERLAAKHREKGFTAAYAPQMDWRDKEMVRATREAFERENIMLAEVGYWENIMDTDMDTRDFHRGRTLDALYLAEELGARCAVNIWGSYCHGNGNSKHDARNFSGDAFAAAVDMARYFIDTVKPRTAFFAYEIFPFDIVDTVEHMQELVKAVDRKQFGVHLDLANLISDPYKYFYHTQILDEMIKTLGDKIVSTHVKDIKLKEPTISVILEEVPAGRGIIDFGAFAAAVNRLPRDTPFMMEHLSSEEEYDAAAAHIRGEAAKAGVKI